MHVKTFSRCLIGASPLPLRMPQPYGEVVGANGLQIDTDAVDDSVSHGVQRYSS